MTKWYLLWETIKKSLTWLLSKPIIVIIIITLIAGLLVYQQGHIRGYDHGYQTGYFQGLADCIPDTFVDTEYVAVIDTQYIPATLDTVSTPHIATGHINLGRNGWINIAYQYPPINAFSPTEIRLPDPITITKTKWITKDKPVLDWQRGCLAGTAGVVIGAIATGVLTVYLLSR